MPPPPPAVPAYAKLNLTLAVLGKRADGYHDLASIFQTISLHDSLRFGVTSDGVLDLAVSEPELQTPENLVLRAAALLRAQVGQPALGAHIELEKEIAVQGGLGGGSSNAALTLLALDQLWQTRVPMGQLEALAARLGSDVPFFLHGGTARIAGRGEKVVPLPDVKLLSFVLAKPAVRLSTAAIFGRVTPDHYGSTEDTDALERAIIAHAPLPLDRLSNSLEPIVFAAYPEVAAARDALQAAGAPLVRMSGSGPTLYAPFATREEAAEVYLRARSSGLAVRLCHSISGTEYWASILGPLLVDGD